MDSDREIIKISKKQHLYVVTGISKLSGEREVVTKPHGLTKTRELRDRLAARQHCRSAYKWLKIESADREGCLW